MADVKKASATKMSGLIILAAVVITVIFVFCITRFAPASAAGNVVVGWSAWVKLMVTVLWSAGIFFSIILINKK
jgi:hypothetical protein